MAEQRKPRRGRACCAQREHLGVNGPELAHGVCHHAARDDELQRHVGKVHAQRAVFAGVVVVLRGLCGVKVERVELARGHKGG